MVHNASGGERSVQGDNQTVFDTRILVVLALPRAGTPVFRAYWAVGNGLLETEIGDSATNCVRG